MRFRMLMIAGALAVLPAAAEAQEGAGQPACAATDTSLPPEMAGWKAKADLAAAAQAAELGKAELALGHATTVTLRHTPDVSYAAQPEKPGGAAGYGGMLALTVKDAGTYRIALSSGAWIDVLNGKTTVASTTHGHGPTCSTIRKIVDFPLEPGRYVIQLSANADPVIAVMAWRQP